ncbi:MAG: ATP-dependent metallopeptidase FtsH/Yme1/Tma family protein [Bacteroidota bacterium]
MKSKTNKPQKSTWIYLLIGLIGLLTLVNVFVELNGQSVKLTEVELKKMLRERQVASITIVNNWLAEIQLKKKSKDYHFYEPKSYQRFEAWVAGEQAELPVAQRVSIQKENRLNILPVILSWVIPIVVILVLIILLLVYRKRLFPAKIS